MLGGSVSGLLGSSGDNIRVASAHEGGGGDELGAGVIVSNSTSSLFGDELQDKDDRSSAGNRWPRQETLALLKIRSDMDVTFRDSSLKGPLWDDVSRKMAELGFHRSAKKCKEKFENVYKYHKRTKDGRATKQDGKNYRFFEELEALDHHHPSLLPSLPPPQPPKPQPPPAAAASTTMAALPVGSAHPPPTIVSHVTVPSTTNPTIATMSLNTTTTTTTTTTTITQPPIITNPTISFPRAATIPPNTQNTIPSSIPNMQGNLMSNSTSSSSTSSDEEFQGRNKRKRKWKEFFERLMHEVIEKQEKLQKKFLEAIEKREHDRMVREESWKMQEKARMNREHEILVQERSMAAAKDAAVIAFLQKISEQQTPQTPVAQAKIIQNENTSVMSRQPPEPQPQPQPQPQIQIQQQPPLPLPPPPPQAKALKDIPKLDNGGNIASPSRWPKAEVQTLINLRTSLDIKYQENGPKGPLWEDISAGMAKIGYNRSAKRCKEKWENINKYFKKVKESNKRRPEDSKTCPYFHLLDALYKEKNKIDPSNSLSLPSYAMLKPDDQNPMAPLMVQPEQQWPLQQGHQQQRHERPVAMEEDVDESENVGQNQGEEEEEDGDDDEDGGDYDEDDDEDDEGGGGYEIVSNKPANTVGNVE